MLTTGTVQLSVNTANIANIANQQGHLREKMMRLQFSQNKHLLSISNLLLW